MNKNLFLKSYESRLQKSVDECKNRYSICFVHVTVNLEIGAKRRKMSMVSFTADPKMKPAYANAPCKGTLQPSRP